MATKPHTQLSDDTPTNSRHHPTPVAQPPQRRPLIDASALAIELGVSRDFIYEHATELGAIRLGNGPKARLRFDPVAAREALACYGSRPSQAENPNAGGQSDRPPARRSVRWPQHRPQPGSILASRPRAVPHG